MIMIESNPNTYWARRIYLRVKYDYEKAARALDRLRFKSIGSFPAGAFDRACRATGYSRKINRNNLKGDEELQALSLPQCSSLSLIDMPFDIIAEISDHLTISTKILLSQTCRSLRKVFPQIANADILRLSKFDCTEIITQAAVDLLKLR